MTAVIDVTVADETLAVLLVAWQQATSARQLFGAEILSGLHNPFGRAARLVDSWALLDCCRLPDLLDVAQDAIGPDIILWDSEFADDRTAAHQDPALWPLDPPPGVTLRAAVTDGVEFNMRYMPATARYNRDPTYPPNRRAAELMPLINYAGRPIWLVRGADRCGNDFVTGFVSTVGQWSDAPW